MTKEQENCDRITARPGTPEFDEQFQRQSNAACARFWAHPVTRVACFGLGLMWAMLFVSEVCDLVMAIASSSLRFREIGSKLTLIFGLGWLIAICAKVTWCGKKI